MADPLEFLAKHAEDRPFFLASVLAAFAQSERLDDAGLTAALGCTGGELTMVRLCRTPRVGAREFRDDVHAIAGRFGLDPARLAAVVKQGHVILRLRAAEPGGGGFLAAARDHQPEPPEEP